MDNNNQQKFSFYKQDHINKINLQLKDHFSVQNQKSSQKKESKFTVCRQQIDKNKTSKTYDQNACIQKEQSENLKPMQKTIQNQQDENKIVMRRPKMQVYLKGIDKMTKKVELYNNKIYQNQDQSLDNQQKQEQNFPLKQKYFLNNDVQQSPDSICSHYMSDRIERKIQKFSKNQISSKLPQSQSIKSRNYNSYQSNSQSNMYQQNSINGFTKIQQPSQNPYFSENFYKFSTPIKQDFYGSQAIPDNNLNINTNDLSFEGFNNINNSYTSGQLNSYDHSSKKIDKLVVLKYGCLHKNIRNNYIQEKDTLDINEINNNLQTRDIESSPLQTIPFNQNATIDYHPMIRPKIHFFKKGGSRRIKTSSATRNLNTFDDNYISIKNEIPLQNQNFSSISNYRINSNAQKLVVQQLRNANLKSTIDSQQSAQQIRIERQTKQQYFRPNTTNLDQLISQYSPQRNFKVNNKQLQEEINGFKHSFYNHNFTPSTNAPYSQEKDLEKENILQKQLQELNKPIFILNNKETNRESTQESSAMTPCFLHTPNRTNNWGDFNAYDTDEEQNKSLFIVNYNIQDYQNNKKPQTSHQSKKESNQNRIQNIDINPSDINIQKINLKPNTSGASFRRPLSRNHPIMNQIKQQGKTIMNTVKFRKIKDFHQFKTTQQPNKERGYIKEEDEDDILEEKILI